MSGRCPLAIIGFDSLDFDLVRRWADAGELPTFQRLFRTGPWSKVLNPTGFEAGTAWMSLITGVAPDQHGIYDAFYQFDPRTYQIRIATPADTGWPSFWTRASQAGRRVAVIDVPYSFLDPAINGIQICDWLVHVSADGSGPKSNSPDVLRKIQENFGLNPLFGPNRCPINDQEVHTATGLSRVLATEEQRIDWKARYSASLLSQGSWDMVMTVFHEAHDIGHMCWHVHDPAHERHDPSVAQAVGDPLLHIYKKLDAATDQLIAATPPGCTVLVYSSHGIGPERTASRLLNTLLAQLELSWNSRSDRVWLDWPSMLYRELVPARLRQSLASTSTMNRLYERRENDRLRHRPFLAVNPSYATGGIHLNVAGRESLGVVRPGKAVRELTDRLCDEFLRLTNAETDEPLVSAVTETSALYSGPARGLLPDILLEWNKSAPIRKIRIPQIDQVLDNATSVRSGDHFLSKDGFVIASGPGLTGGQRDSIRVTDLTATLGARLESDISALPGSMASWLGSS